MDARRQHFLQQSLADGRRRVRNHGRRRLFRSQDPQQHGPVRARHDLRGRVVSGHGRQQRHSASFCERNGGCPGVAHRSNQRLRPEAHRASPRLHSGAAMTTGSWRPRRSWKPYYSNENDEHAITGNFFGVFGNTAQFRYRPGTLSTALQAPGCARFHLRQQRATAERHLCSECRVVGQSEQPAWHRIKQAPGTA